MLGADAARLCRRCAAREAGLGGNAEGGSLVPSIESSKEFLSIIVAIIGTTVSAYLYTWQSNEEVAEGKITVKERQGATDEDLRRSQWEILVGMTFSNLIMYFIILATGSTLHVNGQTEIETAAQAAEAVKPIAGDAAGYLFAAGIVSVGFLPFR